MPDFAGAKIRPGMYLSKRFAALPPRQKLLARIALYGGIALTIGLAILGISILARPLATGRDAIVNIDELKETEAVRLLQRYIQIDTSPTTGSEVEGAMFLADYLRQAGLEPHIELLGDGNANLWAILEGKSPEAIVLHNHIDVYPAGDPEKWDFPPFGGVIDKAWIYGRGTFDMKSLAIAQLLAIVDLAKAGERPEKTVIFLASGSEEVGSDLGSRWILAQHPTLARRFSLVLTEGGVVEAIDHEEIKYWGVEFAQKWFADGWACAPTRERLEALRDDLNSISDSNFDLRLATEIHEFLEAYGSSRGSEKTQEMLGDLLATMDHIDQYEALPVYLKSLFRDETAPFKIEPDPESNGYRMRIILHLLPGTDFENARDLLLPVWATHGVTVSIDRPLGANHGSPIDHPAFRLLAEALREDHPKATVGPYFLAWSATDARFFRQAGIPTYGFSPFLIFVTDTFRRDTLNERIDLRGFVEGVDLYRRIVGRLTD